MKIAALVLLSVAARGLCDGEIEMLEKHPVILEVLHDYQQKLELQINSQDPPYRETEYYRKESSCFSKWFTCQTTAFGTRYRLSKMSNSSVSPVFHRNTPLVMLGDGSIQDKESKSTAVTESTTKGWKISLKLYKSNVARTMGAEVQAQYGEHYTKATTVTSQQAYTLRCPACHSCAMYTMTVMATIGGTCDAQQRVLCSWADQDICQDFEFKCQKPEMYRHRLSVVKRDGDCPERGSTKIYQWQTWGCGQYRDFARQNCGSGSYEQASCSIRAPVIKANGEPASAVIGISRPIKNCRHGLYGRSTGGRTRQAAVTVIKPLDES